jgi:UDP-N-acetylglucosamine--dolichyl-phosphate N-acetylglucosaminephosphotransferase
VLLLKIFSIFVLSFLTTFIATKYFLDKFKEKGFVAKDMYKLNKPDIPTMGGLSILSGVLSSLIASQFLVLDVDKLLIFYFVVVAFTIFGLLDDLIDIGRKLKIFAPFFLAFPIALLNIDTSLWIVFTSIELGLIYSYIIAPVYVMVVTNLINMHSGYNGLSGGLSAILLSFIGLKIFLKYNGYEPLIYLMPIFGAVLAFMFYNKYPSKIFLGNSGTLMLGSAIGGLLILNNMEIFGVVILIPHILNFLMYIYCLITKKPTIKWGSVDEKGYLKVPSKIAALKYTIAYYMKVTEPQAVLILYGITTLFGFLGLIFVP